MHIDTYNNTQNTQGILDPKTAWSILENYNESLLVDVRTKAELNYVGYPDLSSLKKKRLSTLNSSSFLAVI